MVSWIHPKGHFAGTTIIVVVQSSQNIIDTQINISYSLRSSDNDFEMIGEVDTYENNCSGSMAYGQDYGFPRTLLRSHPA